MGKLEDRENRRKSAVAGLIRETEKMPGKERKQRVCLALRPSLYEDLQKVGFMQRRSASQIVGELIEKYVQEHVELLEEYREIERKK